LRRGWPPTTAVVCLLQWGSALLPPLLVSVHGCTCSVIALILAVIYVKCHWCFFMQDSWLPSLMPLVLDISNNWTHAPTKTERYMEMHRGWRIRTCVS
jgi:hypothetical protein